MDEGVANALARVNQRSPRAHNLLNSFLLIRNDAEPGDRIKVALEFTQALVEPASLDDRRWLEVAEILSDEQRLGTLRVVLNELAG
jgi:hypothetical protein